MLAPFPGFPPPPPHPPPRNVIQTSSGAQQGWQNLTTNASNMAQQFAPIVHPSHNMQSIPTNFSHPLGGLQPNTQQYGKPVATAVPVMTSTDILGIAEKAATAVQALSQNMNKPPTHPTPVMVPVSQQQQHTHAPGKPNTPSNGNLITDDLSPMVQYAVKNLKATGHLDKELGSNACRMLQKLPGNVALNCLDKFSSCDVSIMRSKEGYLIGILRKAANRH